MIPKLSMKTWLTIAGAAVLSALLVWQFTMAQSLKVKVAELETARQADQLRIQAANTSNASCQLALAASSRATDALARGAKETTALVTEVLRRGQDRAVSTATEVTRLLSVRPAAGQDCQAAENLARAAWEEGQ